jgi:hypothetical protein
MLVYAVIAVAALWFGLFELVDPRGIGRAAD